MNKEELKELNNIIFDKLNTKEYSNILGEYTRLIQENKQLKSIIKKSLNLLNKIPNRTIVFNDKELNFGQTLYQDDIDELKRISIQYKIKDKEMKKWINEKKPKIYYF